jgi:predicted permease
MLSDVWIRMRSLFRRRAVEQELDEELRFHVEQQAAKHVRAGMTREEALRQARLEFGGEAQVEMECREARGISLVETVVQDLKFGVRMLRKSPGFTLVVVLTLAIGIGANTAIFTLVQAVLLETLPVKDPQELVVAEWSARNRPNQVGTSSFGDCQDYAGVKSDCSLSYPMFEQIRAQKNLFASVTAFAGPAELDLSGNGAATIAQGMLVAGNYFETLGVVPAVGRTLDGGDDEPGANAVAVLDYAYWQRAFGGSPDVIGRTIRLNNSAFTIVGVTDARFTRLTPGKAVDLWIALSQGPRLGVMWSHVTTSSGDSGANDWWLVVLGRLQPGVARKRAEAAVNAIYVNGVLHGSKPNWKASDDPHLWLLPAEQGLSGIRQQYGKSLLLLMAAVGMVLLIACANLAGLMLARGAAREREMAVRLAVGAARKRVVRQLLTESLMLSFVGAGFGALLAYAGATGLAVFYSENAYGVLRLDLHLNAPVLLFAMGAAVLTGIGFGLAPALRGARANVATELKGGSATTTRGPRRFNLGNGLVVMQVALSMVVMTGAGLVLRTLDKLHSIDPGFDTHNVLLFTIDPELAGYTNERITALYTDLDRRLAGLPGVESASHSSIPLLDGGLWTEGVKVEGQTGKENAEVQMMGVGARYLETMKIPLLEGRFLRAGDIQATQHAAVVNRAFVRKYLGKRNPLGMHFGSDDGKDPQWEIVGVVGDTRYATLRDENAPTAFVPQTSGGTTFALRTAADPAMLMGAARNAVSGVDSNLPVERMRTQTDAVDRLLFDERLLARLFGLFGVLGLTLAAIGLYGLLSYEVARRTREIGIRTALGAKRRDVLALVLRQGLVLVVVGAAVGSVAASGVTRLLQSELYAVRPTDPMTFSLVGGLLVAVGVAACLLPAWRATRVDPMEALRCE